MKNDNVKQELLRIRQDVAYISVDNCAELLGVSKSTVYQMLRDGRFDGAFRINRTWRIPVSNGVTN